MEPCLVARLVISGNQTSFKPDPHWRVITRLSIASAPLAPDHGFNDIHEACVVLHNDPSVPSLQVVCPRAKNAHGGSR